MSEFIEMRYERAMQGAQDFAQNSMTAALPV
jgi:hypothetical protein